MPTNSKPESLDNKEVKMLLRDRDTGELVLKGTIDLDGQWDIQEVGPGYLELLKQIGVGIGQA